MEAEGFTAIGKLNHDDEENIFKTGKGKSSKWAEDDKKTEEAAAEPEVAKRDPLELATELIGSGKKGEELATAVKAEKDLPGWALLYKCLTTDKDCSWKDDYTPALLAKLGESSDRKEQVKALFQVQKFLHENNFEPKGLIEKIFITLYNADIIESDGFVDWKDDYENEMPGRAKAIIQITAWMQWLETPDPESEEEEEDE
jgi:hypothetical protein